MVLTSAYATARKIDRGTLRRLRPTPTVHRPTSPRNYPEIPAIVKGFHLLVAAKEQNDL
jgi:hypothetical protein